MPLKHFLLVFDHKAGQLLSNREFEDLDQALAEYSAAEVKYDAADWVEVVLVGSDSIDTVKQTHANYFDGTAGLADALARILAEEAGEGWDAGRAIRLLSRDRSRERAL